MTTLMCILGLMALTMWMGKRIQRINLITYALVAMVALLQVGLTIIFLYKMKPPI